MSGGEPSSIKRSSRCAARVPVLSMRLENRVGADFDLEVYGLVLQLGTVFFDFADRVAECRRTVFGDFVLKLWERT